MQVGRWFTALCSCVCPMLSYQGLPCRVGGHKTQTANTPLCCLPREGNSRKNSNALVSFFKLVLGAGKMLAQTKGKHNTSCLPNFATLGFSCFAFSPKTSTPDIIARDPQLTLGKEITGVFLPCNYTERA